MPKQFQQALGMPQFFSAHYIRNTAEVLLGFINCYVVFLTVFSLAIFLMARMFETKGKRFLKALKEDNEDKVLILLEKGLKLNDCKVKCRPLKGSPLASHAAYQGAIKILTLLLELGADVNCTDQNGFTALHWAALKGHNDCAETLITFGADIESKAAKDVTPLILAAQERQLETVRLLLELSASTNHSDESGFTALHFAALKSNSRCAKELLEHGASVNAQTSKGTTALHEAVSSEIKDERCAKCIEVLIAYGADINKKDTEGNTPLHKATIVGNLKLIKLLLTSSNVQLLVKNGNNQTALDLADEADRVDINFVLTMHMPGSGVCKEDEIRFGK